MKKIIYFISLFHFIHLLEFAHLIRCEIYISNLNHWVSQFLLQQSHLIMIFMGLFAMLKL